MQKIALISEHASPLAELGSVDAGGQNVYVAQIAAELGRRGYRVDVFTRRDRQRLPSVLTWRPNVQVVHVPAGPPRFVPKEELLPHMGEFARYLGRFCGAQAEPYDLLHANFFMSGMAARHVKHALGLPFVMTFHALGRVRRQYQGAADGFDDSRFAIEEQLMRDSDAIVAECEQDERDMVALYGADRDRIECVPCGFDPAEFWPVADARARLGVEPSEFVVLQLGRMVARKGVDNVIRAVGLLRRVHDIRARLFIVGGNGAEPDPVVTPELGRLMAIAREEGIAESVTFTGSRPRAELRSFYSAADVFVTTPWYEPFGITPLEAMACARPVIGADVGGLKSTIVHGKTGYLVEPRNPQALCERLAALKRNPALARRMGLAGRRRANERYTWQSIVDRLEVVYRRTAARSGYFQQLPTRRASRPIAATSGADVYAGDLGR